MVKKKTAKSLAVVSELEVTKGLDESELKKFGQTNRTALKNLEAAKSFEISDAESYGNANSLLAATRKAGRELEGFRKFLTKPLADHKKRIDAFFKGRTAPIVEADGILVLKILAFDRAEAERLAEIERKKQEEWQKKNKKARALGGAAPDLPEEEPEPEPVEQRSAAGLVSKMKIVDFEVEDLLKVPRKYLVLDTVKVRSDVKAGVVIPGIKRIERETIAVR